MSRDESVTRWIDQVKQGDSTAAKSLWEHYFSNLVSLARKKLRHAKRRVSDEEDVALSVLNKFFHSAQQGRYPDLSDRNGLWRLLIKMTADKVVDVTRKETRLRRGGGQVRGDSIAGRDSVANDDLKFAHFLANEPTPELVAVLSEQLNRILDGLDEDMQLLVIGKMEGYTNDELSVRLDVSTRTIERRLRLIREMYRQELSHD